MPSSAPPSTGGGGLSANGVQIATNNYQWVWSNTANPTTRPDGSALVAGDRILVAPGVQDSGGFTLSAAGLWLSDVVYEVDRNGAIAWDVNGIITNQTVSVGTTTPAGLSKLFFRDLFVYVSAITLDASNFWSVQFRVEGPAGSIPVGNPLVINTTGGHRTLRAAINAEISLPWIFAAQAQYLRTGNPAAISARSNITYQISR
jgi:hypothetical protein